MSRSCYFISSIVMLFVSVIGSLYFVEIKRHAEIFIPNAKPGDVFMVFGNFTNFFILEPQLIRYKLISEFNGVSMEPVPETIKYNEFQPVHQDRLLASHRNWSYLVWYEEYYQHLPWFLTNKNHGHYVMHGMETKYEGREDGFDQVQGENKDTERDFQVSSHHETEFLPGRPISSKAINIFKPVTRFGVKGTLVIEDLFYSSPVLFLPLAVAEVETQRPKVLNALLHWVYI